MNEQKFTPAEIARLRAVCEAELRGSDEGAAEDLAGEFSSIHDPEGDGDHWPAYLETAQPWSVTHRDLARQLLAALDEIERLHRWQNRKYDALDRLRALAAADRFRVAAAKRANEDDDREVSAGLALAVSVMTGAPIVGEMGRFYDELIDRLRQSSKRTTWHDIIVGWEAAGDVNWRDGITVEEISAICHDLEDDIAHAPEADALLSILLRADVEDDPTASVAPELDPARGGTRRWSADEIRDVLDSKLSPGDAGRILAWFEEFPVDTRVAPVFIPTAEEREAYAVLADFSAMPMRVAVIKLARMLSDERLARDFGERAEIFEALGEPKDFTLPDAVRKVVADLASARERLRMMRQRGSGALLPRYQARAQQPDGPFESVGVLTTLGEAKRIALAAQKKRGGQVHVTDEGGEVVWSSGVTADTFVPTTEEIKVCAELTKLTGLSSRTLVIALSHQLASLRITRDELSKANGELREEVEHALDLARTAPPQRPGVGPWVEEHKGRWVRLDERGIEVGWASLYVPRDNSGDVWSWGARRRCALPVKDDAETLEAARDAADAVLRESFDLDGGPRYVAGTITPQRLCVGPWAEVEGTYTGGASERRHNMFGDSAGDIAETSDGWVWFAAVPYAAPEEGGDGEGLSREQARAIVDSKLRERFDLDGKPAKETS